MPGQPDNLPPLPPFRTVLVTRPAEDAAPLLREIRRRGAVAVAAPLLRITPAGAAGQIDPGLAGMRGLLFTSANGVRAFARLSDRRDAPVYAVGAATAAQARRDGFLDVAVAGGDVRSLAELVRRHRMPADGALVHVAGSHVAGDLAGLLESAGFEVRRIVLYHAVMVSRLPRRGLAAVQGVGGAAVLLYSPRTAQAFVRLVQQAGAAAALTRCAALCLSPAVAEAAGGLPWHRVVVAAMPDQNALLEALEHLWQTT